MFSRRFGILDYIVKLPQKETKPWSDIAVNIGHDSNGVRIGRGVGKRDADKWRSGGDADCRQPSHLHSLRSFLHDAEPTLRFSCGSSARHRIRWKPLRPRMIAFASIAARSGSRRQRSVLQKGLGDDVLLDLRSAFEDRQDSNIAVDPLDVEVPDVAVSAEDLKRVVSRLVGGFGGNQLGH